MNRAYHFYRLLNLLSIDIAVGATISSVFFSKILITPINPAAVICLGLTVWIIYTADHLADVRSLKNPASTDRHRFHQLYYKPLLSALLVGVAIIAVLAFFIDAVILRWGFFLAASIVVYFFIQSRLKIMKEVIGAILYTAGVLMPSLPLTTNITPFTIIFILQFMLTALLNLILFSWFDVEKDRLDLRTSLITSFGYTGGKFLIAFLLILQSLLLLILYFLYAPGPILLVSFVMNFVLGFIFIFHLHFSVNDRYRYAGDAIFLLPVIYILSL